jgi:hypothetical protein
MNLKRYDTFNESTQFNNVIVKEELPKNYYSISYTEEHNNNCWKSFVAKDNNTYYIGKSPRSIYNEFKVIDNLGNTIGTIAIDNNKDYISGYSFNDSINVKDEFRRLGIASTMVDYVEDLFKKKYKPTNTIRDGFQKVLDNRKINEYVSNEINVKYLLKKMLMEIKKIVGNELQYEYVDIKNKLTIYNVDKKFNQKIQKVLNKYEKEFIERNNIIMNYKSSTKFGIKFNSDDDISDISPDKDKKYTDYYIIVKDINIGRVKPEKYILHKSKTDFVESIEENGLKPSKSQNYKGEELSIDYPPSIFAIRPDRSYLFWGDVYWIIDTTKCNNKWFRDLNFPTQQGIYMTYDPIPKEALIYLGGNKDKIKKYI